ncbi:hypothetical protein HH212_02840 [Massilia forsythiae]|uniref:Uncharacterized protein n=1 Tax=Massilia forsythiae TaxID=2728020 RepID=A0A7Z2VU15_9BURK|nr:protealysin inhibitor emfourin [Massilia forsythiae]QJD99102.1 hypothetical protein HH212_02840 [Massilia forsythiae]
MKISAIASGGFAGRVERLEVDTACRPDGKSIEALLEQLDFFGAQPAAGCPIGADLQRWEITADDGRRCRSVVLHEDGAPAGAGWQALLAHLRTGA